MLPFGPNSHRHTFPCVRTANAQTLDPWLSCKNKTHENVINEELLLLLLLEEEEDIE